MITLIRHPKRKKGFMIAVAASVVVHVALCIAVYYAPIFGLAMKLRGVEFVDEDYNHAILIDFSKKLEYPSGYLGFRPPDKVKSLEEIEKDEKEKARRAKLEAARRREQERLAEQRRQQEEAAQREADEKAKADALAQASTESEKPVEKPADKPETYGAFGRINTAPIKDQVKRLYDAKQDGRLVLPEGRLKIGVTGTVKADGTLVDYKITHSSGIKEIDDAALAILAAVSESKAMGPLHQLTSLSMVLDIDQQAQLIVTGFTENEEDARNITNLAQAALLVARFKKSNDEGAMLMLNNLKVRRDGQRIQAIISMPREKATESLTKTMAKGQG
ncbi:MAG TPA: TonB C-terminal domain-containing protein [Blastocatellia bacterium]|nr:TonB C-terminal domain-containing protein [Blastocatellia bacterium]